MLFDKMSFAHRLKELRKQKYSSQEAFSRDYNAEHYKGSEATGGIYGTLQKYENEKSTTVPTVDTLMKICEYLNCDPDYLLGYHDGKTWGAQQVMEYTGLSVEAVELLSSLTNDPIGHEIIQIINSLILDRRIVRRLYDIKMISDGIMHSKITGENVNSIRGMLDVGLSRLNAQTQQYAYDTLNAEKALNVLTAAEESKRNNLVY